MGVLPCWWSILSFQDILKFSTWDLITTIQHLQSKWEKVPMQLPGWLRRGWKHQPSGLSCPPSPSNNSTRICGTEQEKEGKRSCVSNSAGMKCGIAGTFASSASLEKLFFHAVSHHQLHLRFGAWPILNPSILLSRAKLNRGDSNRPIKNRKKKQNLKSHDLNQMILWLSMCVERIVCGNMWSRIEQNKEEWKGRKRETGEQRGRDFFRHSG